MILTDIKLKSYDLLKSMPWHFREENWCFSVVCSRVCLLQNLWQESWPMKSSTSVSSTALRNLMRQLGFSGIVKLMASDSGAFLEQMQEGAKALAILNYSRSFET